MAPITATFALFLGVGLTGLAINTTRLRVRFGRDLDKPAKEAIRRASRAHGNTGAAIGPLVDTIAKSDLFKKSKKDPDLNAGEFALSLIEGAERFRLRK